jgi:hypothetical protein
VNVGTSCSSHCASASEFRPRACFAHLSATQDAKVGSAVRVSRLVTLWTTPDSLGLTAPGGLARAAITRLHEDAAGSPGTYVSRPKDEERLARRDLVASEVLGGPLGELAASGDREEVAR